ncbi:MAG TPA: hypothetical protein VFR72_06840, partial [Gemmatimonadales bacterium]|nr:hypothetical protein [Gemmatimonadales bacterium]
MTWKSPLGTSRTSLSVLRMLVVERSSKGGEMDEPTKVEPVRVEMPMADWQEIRRRQEKTRVLIARIHEAQKRLDEAVDKATAPTPKS